MSQSESEWMQFINDCDAQIRAGQLDAVVGMMRELRTAEVPRRDRWVVAKICRRVGLILEGLRLLYPIVRGDEFQGPPSAGEICEYAVLLSRNGSTREALNLLRAVDKEKNPEALFCTAICEIAVWNYEDAAKLLEAYIAVTTDPYPKLVASVNLGAAYLANGKLDEAVELLLKTIAAAKTEGASRLIGNSLEQLGHYYFRIGDLKRAEKILSEAAEIFGESKGYDRLLILKWQAILQAFESQNIKPLIELRRLAVERRHWETVREADLFSLRINFDQKIFDHLYYGTPMPGYKKWLREQLPQEPSSFYVLGRSDAQFKIDFQRGEFEAESGVTKIPKANLELFKILLRDFYLPIGNGSIFSSLYPDEYFNSQSSPLKIRQALYRFRRWIEKMRIPILLESEAGGYRLQLQGSVSLTIAANWFSNERIPARWQELRLRFETAAPFTASDVEESLKISRASALRVIKWGLEEGLILKWGRGQASTYEFLQTQPS